MKHGFDPLPSLALLRLDKREWKVLLPAAADAKYVPTGHLVFLREGTLMAVRFDLARLEVVGQPAALVENIVQALAGSSSIFHTGAGQFGISESGTLVYAEGGIVPNDIFSLVWVDQQGNEQPAMAIKDSFFAPRLSPEGRKIAYGTLGREWCIWVYDLIRGTNSRLVSDGRALFPIWAPDGKRLLFSWHKSLTTNLFWQPPDGSSAMARLTNSERNQWPSSCSPDGKTVALVEMNPDTGMDIVVLDVATNHATPFLNSRFNEQYPEFSPDGRWIAYTSNESSRTEVYVRSFPGSEVKFQVSHERGQWPMWARNGRQLFYKWQDKYWAVDIRTDGEFSISKPRLLFDKSGYGAASPIRGYDLSLDSQRFLMVKDEARKPQPITEMILVQNWFEELKRLVPTGKK